MAARSGVGPARVIRPARPTDLDELTRAHLAAFAAGNGPALPRAVLARVTAERMRGRWQQQLDSPLPGSLLLVAECAGHVVGTAASGPLRDRDGEGDGGPATTGELYSLYVDPADWGAGHGTALHAAALEHLKDGGFTRAVLWVLEGNARARAFYGAYGWIADGGRHDWEGAPVVRMAREL